MCKYNMHTFKLIECKQIINICLRIVAPVKQQEKSMCCRTKKIYVLRNNIL